MGLVGWPRETAQAFIKKKYNVNVALDADGACVHVRSKHGEIMIIHLNEFKMAPPELAVLSHEANHAAILMTLERGQGISDDHEHLTYLQQHIFQRLLTTKLQEKKTRRK